MAEKENDKELIKDEDEIDENNGENQTDDSSEASSKKRFNFSKKNILIISSIFLLGLILMAILFYFLFYKNDVSKKEPIVKEQTSANAISKTKQVTDKKPADNFVYIDMNEIIVNLAKLDGQSSFLKLAATIEVSGADNALVIKEKMPLIRDAFQIYLRELRTDDLQGSAGIYRLKQELLLRVNKITSPIIVNDVLFRDVLIQ
jgi:flagellar FliL protein